MIYVEKDVESSVRHMNRQRVNKHEFFENLSL